MIGIPVTGLLLSRMTALARIRGGDADESLGGEFDMDPLFFAMGLAFLAALWFVPIGAIRLMAYRSKELDHTRGMQKVARTILGIGIRCLVAFGILTVICLLTR